MHPLLPPGTDPTITPIFAARALRGFADGFVAVLLPVYLLALDRMVALMGVARLDALYRSAAATACVRRSEARAAGTFQGDSREAGGTVLGRFVCGRAGGQLAAGAVAVPAVWRVAGRRRCVLFWIGLVGRLLTTGGTQAGAAYWLGQHDGVHPHSRKPVPDRGSVCNRCTLGTGLVAGAGLGVVHGCAGAQRVCGVGGATA